MKSIYKIGIAVVAIVSIIIICILDSLDRKQYYSMQLPTKEMEIFFIPNDPQKQENVYVQHFNSDQYKFPRKNVAKVKLYNNSFLTSRLTVTTVSENEKRELISFFNNPSNFDWGETTWEANESEYILRFFDDKHAEIGKVWLCLEGCGMTRSMPFSPNMKYGGLSKTGKKNIDKILGSILSH